MKKIIILISAILFGLQVQAQKKLYFDAEGNKVKTEDAVYYKIVTKNGSKFRIKEYYASNSQLKLSGSYITGVGRDEDRAGRFVAYYDNAQIDYQVRYKNGKEEGEYISYYKNGKEKAKGVFFGGKKSGDWLYYHENGQISGKGKYFAGEYNGDWEWYYEDATPSKKARYKNGIKDGVYQTFYKDGKTEIDCRYDNDSLDGWYKEYWINQNPAALGKFNNNKRDSSWSWFHENGKLSCKANFERGEFNNGDYYNEDGEEMDKRVRSGSLVKMPKYPGGVDNLSNLVLKRLDNQEIDMKAAKKVRYEKTVIFTIDLDTKGKPTAVKMISPNEEKAYSDPFEVIAALRTAMADLPEFTPKRAYNRYVSSTIAVGVTFNAVTKSLAIAVLGIED